MWSQGGWGVDVHGCCQVLYAVVQVGDLLHVMHAVVEMCSDVRDVLR